MDVSEQPRVGQPVNRKEDDRLLTGGGRYTDDVSFPNQTFGYFLRSAYAHGAIRRIDTRAARTSPRVIAVYTAVDLAPTGYGYPPCPAPITSLDGTPVIVPPRPLLASARVRYVGEPVALVVADSPMTARDAAERIELDIDLLPVVTDMAAAIGPDAPRLHDEAPGNVCLDWRFGDFDAIERAIAGAAHVTRLRIENNRVVALPLEPRAAVAEFDAAADRFTLHVGCQGVFGLRNTLATEVLRIEPERLRVLAGDVGGSFGMKGATYPEYAILLHAARDIGRPVKWADERSDSFLSDHHGRDAVVEGELALDEEGRILAVRITGLANMGAYVAGFAPAIPTMNLVKNVASLYRTPLIGVATRCVLTNTTPISAYRGAGRPEGNYYMERLLDAAARETGRDPVELRRGNMIPRDALPFRAGSGLEYDSGDFEAVMDACLDSADWAGFPARRAETERRGRLRGIGLACYLEVTAPPGKEMGGVRFEADGHVSIVTGTLDYGQGHASTFAQILSDVLGLPFDRIRLIQGDSDQLLVGGGTGGSRSTMASGAAIIAAAGKVVEQGRALAAHLLETAEDDIEFAGGVFRVVGTDRSVSLLDLAAELRKAGTLPDDLPRGLDAMIVVDTPPSAFPNGCHIAEVEIDPETGATEVASYVVVDDFGNLINPVLVEGQVHGGVVQGLGQALMERVSYDGEGNLRSGSLMDYAVPRATHVPPLAFASHPVPATTNPLGAKGCGEAGVTGALPAVMNAVVDALSAQGVTHVDMPATPERLWSILRAGK